jgi:dsDNA-specific endonuclease/ATPase MutS2
MTSLSDKFDAFISDFSTFKGRMTRSEEVSEQWRSAADIRLTNIEQAIQKVCLDNEQVNSLFQNLKNGETRQREVNIEQKAKNESRDLEQRVQANKTRDLEEKDRAFELKLTPRQAIQLNAASIGTILIALWELLKFVYHINI